MNRQSTNKRSSDHRNLTVDEMRKAGKRIVSILGLTTFTVGVHFVADAFLPAGALRLESHRYCQALMLARQGQNVVLDGEGISCPAAASAFGFRPLPEGLRSGKGLVGFGIVSDSAVGRRMFEDMPRFETGQIHHLELFPLEQADRIPQVVVVEGEVEKLMWLVLSYLHAMGGQRVMASTAVLQATCVDATIIPFLEERLNFGFGCYGCRDASDLVEGESIVGFPAFLLTPIVAHLEFLGAGAIPVSRRKKAWQALKGKTKKL
ncbi:MAG: DUF169 domain-containing protein [Deltaproteobacteria bacterium]|nr:DUF169 domain-containing protein [Deltaproteobacteria bacterium]